MSETSEYQEQFRKLKAKREEIEREFPIEKAVAVKKMTRLDALKARVQNITIWDSQADADYVNQLQEDIERLVAVLDIVEKAEPSWKLWSFGWVKDLSDALAYWMEPMEEGK